MALTATSIKNARAVEKPTVCASRIVTTGLAGSDDTRNAPAGKDFPVAGARDDPT